MKDSDDDSSISDVEHRGVKAETLFDRAVRMSPWLSLALMSVAVARMTYNTNSGNEGARNVVAATMVIYMLPCLTAAPSVRRHGLQQRTAMLTLFSLVAGVLAAIPGSLDANANLWGIWGWMYMPAFSILVAYLVAAFREAGRWTAFQLLQLFGILAFITMLAVA